MFQLHLFCSLINRLFYLIRLKFLQVKRIERKKEKKRRTLCSYTQVSSVENHSNFLQHLVLKSYLARIYDYNRGQGKHAHASHRQVRFI